MRSIIEMPRPTRSLLRDERGSVAIIFGMALLPLIFFTGASVDYARAFHAKTVIQAAADAAVTAAANYNGTDTQKKQLAANVFAANAEGNSRSGNAAPTLSDVVDANNQPTGDMSFTTASRWGTINTTVSITSSQIIVKPSVDVPMSFMKLTRINTMTESAQSIAQGSTKKIEVAMMIDLTGSMGWNDRATTNPQTKISDLKAASADFLNILFPNGATTSSTTRVAIAPFADYVNAGSYVSAVTGLAQGGGSTNLYAKNTNLAVTKQGAYTGSYSGTAGTTAAAQPIGSQFGAQNNLATTGATFNNGTCSGMSGAFVSHTVALSGHGTLPLGVAVPGTNTGSLPPGAVSGSAGYAQWGNVANSGWLGYESNAHHGTQDYVTTGAYIPMADVLTWTDYVKDTVGTTYLGIAVNQDSTSIAVTAAGSGNLFKIGTGGVTGFRAVTGYANGAWTYSNTITTANKQAFIPIPSFTGANPGSGNCTTAVDQPNGNLISCVTERTGTDAYTAVKPVSGSWIGPYNQGGSSTKQNYSSDGKCYVAGRELPAIIPLTNTKQTLTDFFTNATVGGGTPGHLGTAWAWYMVSPEWNSIFPTASAAAPYTDDQTIKAVVLMTDGEYNEQYSSATSKDQALALCTAMRAKGVKVYTIGFGFAPTASNDTTSEAAARSLLTTCAGSVAGTYFFPYDSATLKSAFTSIGNSINSLALSQIKVTQ